MRHIEAHSPVTAPAEPERCPRPVCTRAGGQPGPGATCHDPGPAPRLTLTCLSPLSSFYLFCILGHFLSTTSTQSHAFVSSPSISSPVPLRLLLFFSSSDTFPSPLAAGSLHTCQGCSRASCPGHSLSPLLPTAEVSEMGTDVAAVALRWGRCERRVSVPGLASAPSVKFSYWLIAV